MKHHLPWLSAVFAVVLIAIPATAADDREYYDDDDDYYEDDRGDYEDPGYDDPGYDDPGYEDPGYDDEGAQFGLHIGPDKEFGVFFDREEYDRHGGRSRFGLRLDEFGGGIFFDLGGTRYRRGDWYCPRTHCRGRGPWGRGLGRGRPGHGRLRCHPVFKRGYRRGREVLIRARMCYDRDGYAYIVPGSRRVVRRYD